MLPQAELLVREHRMLPPGAKVLCAVSGGADSMCLLHWLSHRGDLTVHAAHFDHRLRGEESDRDARFVRDWCAENRIPFHLGAGDVKGRAEQLGQGIEETARQMRYAFLSETAQAVGADAVATAHTADDNAETLLLNLIRGTGLQGLGGISPRRGNLVRPLLTTTREDVEAYLTEHQIPHVEDSSNQNDDFLRNKVRHQLVPLLEAWNPGFTRRLSQTVPRLRADNDCLDALAADLSQKAVVEGGTVALPARFVSGVPGPVAVRVVRQLLAMAPGGSADCAAAHLEAVLALCRSDDPSGEVHLPHGLTARREYHTLLITSGEKPRPLPVFSPVRGTNPVPGTGWAAVLKEEPWPGLVIRSRQTGDRMSLDGKSSKTVKELFIDRKVPRWSRDTVPIAADAEGILAVAGLGVNRSHPKGDCVQFILQEKEERET